ncbi:MAG: restriction endonuclease subunit S [Verrucomicrobia bacterium]|nr:restriction endonuclease subunit S [Verrucomicrobiota bacterium]
MNLHAIDIMTPLSVNPHWARLPLFDRKGWRTMAFGEFAESVNERVEPSTAAEEIYVGLDDLDSGSLHIRWWGKGSDVIGTKLRFRKGDIIFGRRRAYQRKLAVAEMDGICSAHAMVVRAKPTLVLPEFLPFLMMSDRFMNRAVEISVGSLSPTINWTTLKHEPFTLPPLDQQRRIAEILWAVDEVKQAFEKSSQAAIVVRRTRMQEAFSDRNYPTVTIKESGDVQLGRQRAPKYQTGAFTKPYLRVANVFDGFIDYSDVLEMDFDKRDFQTYSLSPGDILLNEGQSRELVGRCAIYDGKLTGCCFQNTLIRYRVGEEVLTDYAFAFFQHCFHTGVFAAISSQTTSIAHLGADRFAKLKIPIPPKREQQKIADTYARIRKAELANLEHLSKIGELQSSILNAVTS